MKGLRAIGLPKAERVPNPGAVVTFELPDGTIVTSAAPRGCPGMDREGVPPGEIPPSRAGASPLLIKPSAPLSAGRNSPASPNP